MIRRTVSNQYIHWFLNHPKVLCLTLLVSVCSIRWFKSKRRPKYLYSLDFNGFMLKIDAVLFYHLSELVALLESVKLAILTVENIEWELVIASNNYFVLEFQGRKVSTKISDIRDWTRVAKISTMNVNVSDWKWLVEAVSVWNSDNSNWFLCVCFHLEFRVIILTINWVISIHIYMKYFYLTNKNFKLFLK